MQLSLALTGRPLKISSYGFLRQCQKGAIEVELDWRET